MEEKKPNTGKVLVTEIGKAFINLIFGNAYNKIGLSLILLILGISFIWIGISQELKHPKILYIIGGLFILASIILMLKRYTELKHNTEKK
jgi:cytochrome c biogenesis protein CcdA